MTPNLLVIGDREALGWVLRRGRTAFPATARREVRALSVGDPLFIYATRGCFKNPTRDRGRVIGRARVESPVLPLPLPVTFGDRSFASGCRIGLLTLAPWGRGVELAELVGGLDAFRSLGSAWAIRLRRPLVSLGEADADRIEAVLAGVSGPASDLVMAPYARWYDASQRAIRPEGHQE